jgi:RNA polymerase sigma-70 factor (ECF subfamily)
LTPPGESYQTTATRMTRTNQDKEDFLRLMDDNKGIIIKICRSYCSDKADCDDLAQEIIYQLWKSAGRFDAGRKFSTWMYRVALNVAISHYRQSKRRGTVVPLAAAETDGMHAVDELPAADERLALLQQSIGRLKELDRALILLFLEEKTYREMADIMGITETNVATRLNRIREKLKNDFNNNTTAYGRH